MPKNLTANSGMHMFKIKLFLLSFKIPFFKKKGIYKKILHWSLLRQDKAGLFLNCKEIILTNLKYWYELLAI